MSPSLLYVYLTGTCTRTQIALFLLQVVSQGMGIAVGQARSKYGIKYPLLYAVPGAKGDIQPVCVSSGSCLCQVSP